MLFCFVTFLPGAARPFSCRLSCAAFLFDFATIDGGAGASGQTSPWRDSTAAQDEPGLEDVEPLLGGGYVRVSCAAGRDVVGERGRCPAPAQSCLPPDGLVPRLASAKRQMQSQPRKPVHKPRGSGPRHDQSTDKPRCTCRLICLSLPRLHVF
jgi:hypothetical protein